MIPAFDIEVVDTTAAGDAKSVNDSTANLLDTTGITKKYGDNLVLRDGSLSVRAGEIHALLGGNGAGKSTLVRIIAGLVPPTSGEMTVRGQVYRPKS